MERIKREKGSVAVYVTIVLFSMLLVLTAIFLISGTNIRTQLETAAAIRESYESDIEDANLIYEELLEKNTDNTQYVSNGLILHYDAINNTGNGHNSSTTTWVDLSGNGNDGIITGGVWQENSLNFTTSNASNGVRTSSNFPIDFNNTFNIVCSLSSVNSLEPLLGSRISEQDGFMLFNYDDNNALSLDTIGSGSRVSLGSRLNVDTNYNITITFLDTTAYLYVNGQLAITRTITKGSINYPLTVFTAENQSNALGSVYSVKVYNRALTASEVLQNYNVDKEKYGF